MTKENLVKRLKEKLVETKRIEKEKRKILLKRIKDQKKITKILEKEKERMTKKYLKPKKYWTAEVNRRAKKIREKELSVENIYDNDEIKEYKIRNTLHSSSFESFLKSYESRVLPILTNNTKTIYSMAIKLEKIGKDEGEIIEYTLESDPYIILQEEDKASSYKSLSQFFNKKLSELEVNGSGWVLKEIEYMDIKIVPYTPLKGGYITSPLPRRFSDMRCIIQQNSRDGRCFHDAIHLLNDYDRDRKNKNRCRDVEKSPFKLDNISYPISREDLAKFEKDNLDYLVYVLELYGNDKIGIFYKNTDFHHKQLEKKVFFFFFKDHYYPISNIDTFLKNALGGKHKKPYFCKSCLCNFPNEMELKEHHDYCNHRYQTKVKYPKPGGFVGFSRHDANLFHPFSGYFDFESILETINKKKGENTVQYQKHFAADSGFLFKDDIQKTSEYIECKTPIDLKMEIDKKAKYILSLNVPLKGEELKKANKAYEKEKRCKYCRCKFTDKNYAVKDHCHFNGKFRGIIHNECNLKRKDKYFLPLFAHNLNYDLNNLIRLLEMDTNVKIIAKNLEYFISLSYRIYAGKRFITVKLIDSLKFLNSSLEKITQSLVEKNFKQTRKFFPNMNIKKKGIFCYDIIKSEKVLDETTSLPPKEMFYNKLKNSYITDEEYEFAKEMWEKWECKTLRDYMKMYLKLDVCLLADCFEKFRKVIHKEYKLDPVYFITGPSLAYQCALKYTGQKLEIQSDPTKYNFIEKGIRGGYSAIHLRYAKANNKDLKHYNPNLSSSFLIYLDVNNLYGWAMSQNLPTGNFKWQDSRRFNINKDRFVDVDLSIPCHLHDKLKDFPLCPTHEDVELVANLYDKKGYICHSTYRREVLSHGYCSELSGQYYHYTG